MKYKTINFHLDENGNAKFKGMDFEKYQKVYHFNEETELCEETDELINTDELVNSSRDTCLDNILDKFMPGYSEDEELSTVYDDLDVLSSISEKAEEYKSRFNLNPDLGISEVFEYVKEYSDDMLTKLKENEKNKIGGSDDVKKDVKEEE